MAHLPARAGGRLRLPEAAPRAGARRGASARGAAVGVRVGDIGADVEAARGAGARAVLVPTPRTRPQEIRAAPEVAPDLAAAVELLLGAPA